MLTINLRTIGTYIWTILIVAFHVVRISLVFLLGSIMSFYVLMFWGDVGVVAMIIIVITMTDWMISLYMGNWWDK